jgi:hypothetical protein
MIRNIKERVFSKGLAMDTDKNKVVYGVPVIDGNVIQQIPPPRVYVLRPDSSGYECWATSCCIFVAFWMIVGIIASM